MRLFVATLVAALLVFGIVAVGQEKKAPDKLVFEAKMGKVTFDHAKHLERAKGDCKVCHDKLFPQSRAPINFKPGMHKPAEAKKIACAACHVAGGASFETKGNCVKCHVKG